MSSGVWSALVVVEPRAGIADPEGRAITDAARHLSLAEDATVVAGRAFRLRLRAATRDEALRQVGALAERLLANPVIQSWRIVELEGVSAPEEPSR